MIPKQREIALNETVSRVLEWANAKSRAGVYSIEELINETLYYERKRLKGPVHSPGRDEDRAFWSGVARSLGKNSPQQQLELLERVTTKYADEIIGHFQPMLFKAMNRYAAPSLSLLLNSVSPLGVLSSFGKKQRLEDSVSVEGRVHSLLSLAQRGTIILAPTHVSNLDSMVIGFALASLGLPPFLYGAGYNLFMNPIFGPFLHRLGAYTVDREKRAPIYKHVLKTFATVSMEMGHHHIFFPGGTRSRSGLIETSLKKGLLGCGIEACQNNLLDGKQQGKIFIVPCTLTYQMVLEAETMIEDALTEGGKARYIIIDDEFSQADKLFNFFRAILRHQSKVHIRMGQALDPFGNHVNDEGESIDSQGRVIDITGYFKREGEITRDNQRDSEFTAMLAEEICRQYHADNVVTPTHIAAYTLMQMLIEQTPEDDLYRILREDQVHLGFSIEDVRRNLNQLLASARELALQGKLNLEPVVEKSAPNEVLSRALIHFTVYHARPAVERKGKRVFIRNRALLHYYSNRLEGYELGGVSHVR